MGTHTLNISQKKEIAKCVLASQDLGVKSQYKAIECIENRQAYTDNSDTLTSALVDYINSAEDLEGLEDSFAYLLNQIERAKQALYNYKKSIQYTFNE